MNTQSKIEHSKKGDNYSERKYDENMHTQTWRLATQRMERVLLGAYSPRRWTLPKPRTRMHWKSNDEL